MRFLLPAPETASPLTLVRQAEPRYANLAGPSVLHAQLQTDDAPELDPSESARIAAYGAARGAALPAPVGRLIDLRV